LNQNKNLIYLLVFLAGIILVWMINSEQVVTDPSNLVTENKEEPLIIVDGKIAPKLTNFVAHMEFIDEKTCLQCHAKEREMNFGSGPVLVKQMPHEYRDNCISCHILPK
jgi:hypothetical protein